MKGFNIACVITGGAIEAGDKVYLIPIQKHGCEPSTVILDSQKNEVKDFFLDYGFAGSIGESWGIVATPFKAEYDGYGEFREANMSEIKSFIQFLIEDGQIITSEEETDRGISFTVQEFKMEYQNWIENGLDISPIWGLINSNKLVATSLFEENQITNIKLCVVKEEILNDFIIMYEEKLKLLNQYCELKKNFNDENIMFILIKAIDLNPIKLLIGCEERSKEILLERELQKFIKNIVEKKSLQEQDLLEIEERLENYNRLFYKYWILKKCLEKIKCSNKASKKLSKYVLNNFWQVYDSEDNIDLTNIQLLFSYTNKKVTPINFLGQDNGYFDILFLLHKNEMERLRVKREEIEKVTSEV